MTMSDITIPNVTGILTVLGFLYVIVTGIVTKRDCKECKTDSKEARKKEKEVVDGDLKSGREEFKAIKATQTDQGKIQVAHGKQLAGIESTVKGMASNVEMLVQRHMGGSK